MRSAAPVAPAPRTRTLCSLHPGATALMIPAQAVHVLWLAAAWTVVNLLTAFAFLGAGVAVAAAAHIGGFVAGLALAKPLLMWRWRRA